MKLSVFGGIAGAASVILVASLPPSWITGGRPGHRAGASRVGSVELGLVLPGVVEVDTINYTITGPSSYWKTGKVAVSGRRTNFTQQIDEIPVGLDYWVKLDATRSGVGVCTGAANFEVTDYRTAVGIRLQCLDHRSTTTGRIGSAGSANMCAVVESASATPSSLRNRITLKCTASDKDNGPSSLTYKWWANHGTILDDTSPSATLQCASSGPVEVALTVSDGDCGEKMTQTVQCSAAREKPHSRSALVRGRSAHEGVASEGVAGTSIAVESIAIIGSGEGERVVSKGPVGSTGRGAGVLSQHGAGAMRGSGSTGARTTSSDPGVTDPGARSAGTTGPTSESVTDRNARSTSAGDSCTTCEESPHSDYGTHCPDSLAACRNLAGLTAPDSPRPNFSRAALCEELLDCMHEAHCANRAIDCLCGPGANPNDCFATSRLATMPGACKLLISEAAETTDVIELATRFSDPNYAIGAAVQVVELCDQLSCPECL